MLTVFSFVRAVVLITMIMDTDSVRRLTIPMVSGGQNSSVEIRKWPLKDLGDPNQRVNSCLF